MKKIYIHILNIAALIVLLVFNFFAYLGMNFTPPTEPYTAEYTFLASFYLIWGIFYYLQVKQNSFKKFLVLILIELIFLFAWGSFWGSFGHTLLENLLE
ncbi:hypothetical protein [Halobacillus litoralis]|uniref:hypothetical protein n=1 Tax=Halobacillus litoralis TaxID=45668 RepID=UPI001CFE7B76|nr:hypothetical protein [Halobacillus litoralis]